METILSDRCCPDVKTFHIAYRITGKKSIDYSVIKRKCEIIS